jgi:hypothetical protein
MAQYAKFECPICGTEHFIEYDEALDYEDARCKNPECGYVRPLYTYKRDFLEKRPAHLDANFVTRSGGTVHRGMVANTVIGNIKDDPTMFLHPILVEVDTNEVYDVFYKEKSYVFGRGGNEVDIVYKNHDQDGYNKVSRRHCTFFLRKVENRYKVSIKDENSTNGTLIFKEGKWQQLRLDQEVVLSKDEVFMLAKVKFMFIDK